MRQNSQEQDLLFHKQHNAPCADADICWMLNTRQFDQTLIGIRQPTR